MRHSAPRSYGAVKPFSSFLKVMWGSKSQRSAGKEDPIRLPLRAARLCPWSVQPLRDYIGTIIGVSLEVPPHDPDPQQQAADCEVRDKQSWRNEGSGVTHLGSGSALARGWSR